MLFFRQLRCLAACRPSVGAGIVWATTTCEAEDRSDEWMARQGEHAWLEEVEGAEALKWVRTQNAMTTSRLGEPTTTTTTTTTYEKVLARLQSKEKIPGVRKLGDHYYNFWTDAENPRGVWRRTSPEEFRNAEPAWETVLDVDLLGKEENESWVWKGHTVLKEEGASPSRTLVALSPGGSDAVVRREFDLNTKKFGGFEVPLGKSRVSWVDKDTLLVGAVLRESDATNSGYPRVAREWKRGTSLEEAQIVFEGQASDVSCGGSVTRSRNVAFEWRYRVVSFYNAKRRVRRLGRENVWYELDAFGVPDDASVSVFGDNLLLELRTAWNGFAAGALVAVDFDDFTKNGPKASSFRALFEPSETTSLVGVAKTKDHIILNVLDTVKSRLVTLNTSWEVVSSDDPPRIKNVGISPVDSDQSNDYFATTSSFLEPSTLSLVATGKSNEVLKQLPDLFVAQNHRQFQEFATTKDGTRIPYFVVSNGDETSPCLMVGYGGFEVSLLPGYSSTIGTWLERGGTYVVANIRGGGEFGPAWHSAALGENRRRAYDDFAAVAEDLVAKRIVRSPKQIGIRGGLNGGLLVANAYLRYPHLFGAVVCSVPLIDMKSYSRLLAGASWKEEYGDPDTDDWDKFLKNYSPYHQIDPARKHDYPPILVTTSTKDDRVHPYHARAFVHRLQGIGASDVLYYENIEGGHGGAADATQLAYVTALYQDFLFDTLSTTTKSTTTKSTTTKSTTTTKPS